MKRLLPSAMILTLVGGLAVAAEKEARRRPPRPP